MSIRSAGRDSDRPMLTLLSENLRVGRRTRPVAILDGKAYSSSANRSLLRSRIIEAVITEPSGQRGQRLPRGSRGGFSPKLEAIKCKGCNVGERVYAQFKQWCRPAASNIKFSVVYRAAVVLNSVIAWLQH